LSDSVGIEGEEEPDANHLLNPLSLWLSPRPPPSTPSRRTPPCENPNPGPSCSVTARAPHAHPAIDMATVGTAVGQHATDHPCPCHLAARSASTRGTFSQQQKPARTPVPHPSTVPNRRHWAAQSAQHTGHVPVHADPLQRHRSRTPAWHRAASPMPPPPCPRVNQTDPDEPRFRLDRTESDRTLTTPLRHRQNPLSP
jgi:hypothetical protein